MKTVQYYDKSSEQLRGYVRQVNADGPHPEDQYPEPPTNDDFNELPEDFQERVHARFERGVDLTEYRNGEARIAREREEFLVVEHQRRQAARARHLERTRHARARAGKASIAEHLEADLEPRRRRY